MENTFFPFLEFEGGFVVETLVYPKYFIHGHDNGNYQQQERRCL
ncbi:hypothetical protein CIPAW_11G208900 [Carya illinoinensis]|uniref:Uncharacterized protein n=1 Tax=Carya illinoinensis TaxID=32201 RepID=A0A8T1PA72_CARIL|nr:hypothetical protein CIPAW_11G208900 [Carya illinoinensis]